jgi:hypothetical protein
VAFPDPRDSFIVGRPFTIDSLATAPTPTGASGEVTMRSPMP